MSIRQISLPIYLKGLLSDEAVDLEDWKRARSESGTGADGMDNCTGSLDRHMHPHLPPTQVGRKFSQSRRQIPENRFQFQTEI